LQAQSGNSDLRSPHHLSVSNRLLAATGLHVVIAEVARTGRPAAKRNAKKLPTLPVLDF
jgi:hypothetical protein